MSPDEMYKLLQAVDELPGFKLGLQTSPGPTLLANSFAFDQSAIDALDAVDWELPIALLNQDLDFMMPEDTVVDWGATAHYPPAEWGARIDVDLGDNAKETLFLDWLKKFRRSLSLRNADTFRRFFLFKPLNSSTMRVMMPVWVAGQDGARCLTDPRLDRLLDFLPANTLTAPDLVNDLFQVSGRVAADSVQNLAMFPYCQLRTWRIAGDGIVFRDNRFNRYELMLADPSGVFIGGLVGWSVKDTRIYYEILAYKVRSGPAAMDAVAGVGALDTALAPVATLIAPAAGVPDEWQALIIS